MILLLSSDLMLIASAQGAAEWHGQALSAVPSVEALVVAARDDSVQMVVIDLRLQGLNVGELAPKLREQLPDGARIIACGPHVHREALAAAAAAGCDEVITRGEFERRINSLAGELTARAARLDRLDR